jgi:hypothetical protein
VRAGEHVVGIQESDERCLDEIQPGVAGGRQPARDGMADDMETIVGCRRRRKDLPGRVEGSVVDQDGAPARERWARRESTASCA